MIGIFGGEVFFAFVYFVLEKAAKFNVHTAGTARTAVGAARTRAGQRFAAVLFTIATAARSRADIIIIGNIVRV